MPKDSSVPYMPCNCGDDAANGYCRQGYEKF